MDTQPFTFVTDTATLCVYDLAALKHRLEDDADWWCWPPSAQLEELNAGNALFVDLGRDGRHNGVLSASVPLACEFEVLLACPGGRLFVGAAEETTSEGMEPDCTRGGLFVEVARGVVHISLGRSPTGEIHLAMAPHAGPARNAFTQPLCFAR